MPFRPPLVAHEYFSADPPELPRRRRGEPGPQEITHAELTALEPNGAGLKAHTAVGDLLTAQVTAAGEGIIRVRLSSDLAARSRSARALALTHPELGYQADVTVDGGQIRIVAGRLTAEVTLEPWGIRFLDTATGGVLTRTAPGVTDISGRMRTTPFGVSAVDGQIVAYHETLDLPADEVLVGTGERFTPLNLRGQRPVMWNFDAFGSESDRAYKNVPFYQSSRGYGVVVDSGAPIEFDFGASTQSVTQIVVPDDLLDYYVLAGPTPGEVLRRYDNLTCAAVTPPKWAFGSWISSGFFVDTQEHVLQRARTIRARGIPCDVLHLDTYWQPDGKWSELRWNTDTFPDPAAMLAELTAMGFKVCLWMNSYISVHSDRFTEAAEKGYLLKRADGEPYVADSWHGSFPEGGIVDFTHPDATAWFQDLLRPLAAMGVQVFKTDFAEGVPADSVAYNGMSGTELHNIYALLFNDAVSAVTREAHGHTMVWGRSSYLGGQRHAAQWGGDTMCSYPALASSMNGGLAHGLSGVPFWSHDTGGFAGTPSDDLFLRWAQFGALSPLLRFHGTTSREPWRYPAVEAGVVDALKLRYRLLPYIYSAALRSGETGEPIMRALMVDSPGDPAAWRAEHVYRLGRDLLVAPVISPEGTRSVYLPEGQWVDWWDGTVVEGGRFVTVRPSLDRIPLYAQLGTMLPMTEDAQTIPDGPWPNVTLFSLGGLSGSAEIRDDDGVTSVTAVREDATFTVTTSGPARISRVRFARVAGHAEPSVVVINGTIQEQ